MRAMSTWGRRAIAAVATAASWVLPLDPARAQTEDPVCAALGAATVYPTIARTQLSTRELVSYGDWSMGSWLMGSACTRRASLQGTYLRDDQPPGPGDLVATSETGTAVRFDRHRTPENHQVTSSLDGEVITGGGRVSGLPELNEEDEEVPIDTSGTRPELSSCRSAFVDAVAASNAFASTPPDLTFGKLFVPKTDSIYLDIRGASTVQIDALVLEGGKLQRGNYSLPHICDEDGGYITFDVDPGTVVVINVATLDVGNCTNVSVDQFDAVALLNVVGRGRKVRIGIESDTYEGIHLLAPQRRVDIVGAGSDIGTYFGPVIADRLKILGYAQQVVDGQTCVDED